MLFVGCMIGIGSGCVIEKFLGGVFLLNSCVLVGVGVIVVMMSVVVVVVRLILI